MRAVFRIGPCRSLLVLVLLVVAPTVVVAAPATAPPAEVQLTDEQLDQMIAPIALYPDALLSQVLMASTYPDQLVEAASWSKAHPDLKGDAAAKQVSNQPWDPSVQSLVAFPQVLATMQEKPAWVQQVGAAFLAEPDAVMESIQRLRAMAQDSGSLTSNAQQTVQVQEAPATESVPAQTIIEIQPTDPEVVYIPSYNPQIVYGAWPYPAYPPLYLPPPFGYGIGAGIATGLAFGVGIGVTNALWGGFGWGGWGHNDVNINVNRYNNIHTNHRIDAHHNSWTRNNQGRIDNARARTNYHQTVPNRGGGQNIRQPQRPGAPNANRPSRPQVQPGQRPQPQRPQQQRPQQQRPQAQQRPQQQRPQQQRPQQQRPQAQQRPQQQRPQQQRPQQQHPQARPQQQRPQQRPQQQRPQQRPQQQRSQPRHR